MLLTNIITYILSTNPTIPLVYFNNSENNPKWIETNDPVMGGKSTGYFINDKTRGVFSGNCVNVPSLKVPGFCKLTTETKKSSYYPDISNYLDKGLSLRVKTSNSNYAGYRIAFTAKDIPRTSIFGGGSFKAGFSDYLNHTGNWQVITIPFNKFSYDWSAYTGDCNTTDPTGKVHHCCTNNGGGKYCPQRKYLSHLTGFEIWAEGRVGEFYLELDWIGVI